MAVEFVNMPVDRVLRQRVDAVAREISRETRLTESGVSRGVAIAMLIDVYRMARAGVDHPAVGARLLDVLQQHYPGPGRPRKKAPLRTYDPPPDRWWEELEL